ncbi:hypothetical protein SAMN04488483_0741 [Pseudomonas helmanticensis]|uniref:Uncharacterized protein n=1 Tax=Pseudomonas helmanticensis TaxID=1471381 RepID=A0ACD2U0R0_9PSED|nr:hypothetical protein [Pseudomonas helmanticensis]SMQ23079.1 hypothetical protein SAMN04488483_0741 [Pseudomonas helmanticensis]
MSEYIDLDEDFDFDSDESMKELDALEAELEELIRLDEIQSEAYEKAFAWFDVLFDFPAKIEIYKSNVASLEKLLSSLDDEPEDRFSRGTLLVGMLSAYEGLVHDLLLLCCQSQVLVSKAIKNLERLGGRDRSYLGLKKNPVGEDLVAKLKAKTLHDPAQVVRMCNVLFELPLPGPHDKEVKFYEALLSARNCYAHVGGYQAGKEYKVSIKTLRFSFGYFHRLVDTYALYVSECAHAASKEADET